ncbi:MAG: hypothetical protein QGH85_01655 [Candidatus Pacebacteria bacterium]|jgi:hypothetical protein|nr:hypothetical protein [Parcubacteria group bacterium]MDP6249487.1 hypothetical protein [Candidatus Paceibacterota bacterium]MDP7159217.1 hypothetical protein [Candidatus Paceibacterota bacterium]MDP7367892.1 hypothetical protein [Candidatus Paceibacterota bacterium]MDP7466307.1 hypothetical protein [Candidatus Paceibacterota bacterium]|tara:strand:- start:555 stop:965 length:411 start_codon:yes stop_codon:yes gene_type:complete
MKVKFLVLVLSMLLVVVFGMSGCVYNPSSTSTVSYSWPVRPFIYPYTEVTVSNNMEDAYVDINSSVSKRSNLGPGDYHTFVFPGSSTRRVEYSVIITIKRKGKAPKSYTERVRVSRRDNDVISFEVRDYGRIRKRG